MSDKEPNFEFDPNNVNDFFKMMRENPDMIPPIDPRDDLSDEQMGIELEIIKDERLKIDLKCDEIWDTLAEDGYSVYTIAPTTHAAMQDAVVTIATASVFATDRPANDPDVKAEKIAIAAKMAFGDEPMDDDQRTAMLRVMDSLLPVEITPAEVLAKHSELN